jgi:hypothetical protein
MMKMLFTRPQRSATSDSGTAPIATAMETMETRPPSSLSERFHCALRCGNIETTTWRSR